MGKVPRFITIIVTYLHGVRDNHKLKVCTSLSCMHACECFNTLDTTLSTFPLRGSQLAIAINDMNTCATLKPSPRTFLFTLCHCHAARVQKFLEIATKPEDMYSYVLELSILNIVKLYHHDDISQLGSVSLQQQYHDSTLTAIVLVGNNHYL